MPVADPGRGTASPPWSVPVLAVLGVAGLVLGWLQGVLPWSVGAVLIGLAVVRLVAWLGWRPWVHLVAVVLVAGLVAVPVLLRPGPGPDGRIEADDPRVNVAEDVLVTLEWGEQVSTLTAWSRSDGQRLWTLSEDAPTPSDSPYPLPLVVGDLVLIGDLHPRNLVSDWPALGALDLATGEQRWTSEVTGRVLGHHDGVLVVATPEQTMDRLEPATLRGLDAGTGEVVWTATEVAPTAGLPMVATDSAASGWGGHLPQVGDLPLLALRPVGPGGTGPGAVLVDPGTGERVAEVPAAAEDGVVVLGTQVVVVHTDSGVRHLQAYDQDGGPLWAAEVAADEPEVNGLDVVPSGAVMTAGDRVLLDDATAVLDLRTGERTDFPVRAVPGSTDDIMVGSRYAVTTAVTETGYFAVLDLATGTVQALPAELGGGARPAAFAGGEDGALLYTDLVPQPFGRTVCRVQLVAASTMAITEHLLGECTEPAEVTFWGEVPMAGTSGGWVALADR